MNINPNQFQAVYYVESSDPTKAYNPVAIKPRFYTYDNGKYVERRCEWRDTDRGAYFYYDHIHFLDNAAANSPPRQFKLIGNNSEEVTFTYLTKKIFDDKIEENTWNRPEFSGDEDLQHYYLQRTEMFS